MLSARLFAGDKKNAWIVAIGGKIYKGEADCSAIGENQFELDLSVYPNPTSGKIQVNSSDQNDKLTITVINAQGQVVSEYHLNNSGTTEIELAGEPAIYFVIAVSDKGGQRVIKVLKE